MDKIILHIPSQIINYFIGFFRIRSKVSKKMWVCSCPAFQSQNLCEHLGTTSPEAPLVLKHHEFQGALVLRRQGSRGTIGPEAQRVLGPCKKGKPGESHFYSTKCPSMWVSGLVSLNIEDCFAVQLLRSLSASSHWALPHHALKWSTGNIIWVK